MCFSPQASFSAAILLGATGAAAMRLAPNRSLLYIAAIPLFFAIQQLVEGILWLNLEHQVSLGGLSRFAPYAYIFFALLFWPIWIPFAMWKAENSPKRKTALAAFLIMGSLLSLYYLAVTPSSNYKISIVQHSIQYDSDIVYLKSIYVFIVLGAIFASGVRGMWIFGMLLCISILLAYFFYAYAFVSVWCFLSALNSFILLGIIRMQKAYFPG